MNNLVSRADINNTDSSKRSVESVLNLPYNRLICNGCRSEIKKEPYIKNGDSYCNPICYSLSFYCGTED